MALFDLLGRRWAMGILWQLSRGPATFRALQTACESISPAILNSRLKDLREAQLVVHEGEGYQLTDLGRELYGLLYPFGDWALGWAGPGPAAWLAGSLGLLLALPSVRLLGQAWRAQLAAAEAGRAPLQGVMAEALNQHGASLLSRSMEGPQLVVFLRHFGCMFCREALAQLARDRAGIEAAGTRLVLVHMASDAEARDFFDRYGLADVDRISDPRRWLYFQLGLGRASLWHLLDLRAWWRSFSAAVLNRHGIGRLTGSALQMPGVFLVHRGTLVSAFVHRTPADRPDYRQLSLCPPLPRA